MGDTDRQLCPPAAETLSITATTYRGACHCGACRFEVDMDIDHVRVCDCSVCRRRGALIHRVSEEQFRLLTPLAELGLYEWHTRTAKDYFCKTCGILPFRKPRDLTDDELAQGMQLFTGWAINVRCLEGVNPENIPIKRIHGSRLP